MTRFGLGDEERLHHMLGKPAGVGLCGFFMHLPSEEAKRKKHLVIIYISCNTRRIQD